MGVEAILDADLRAVAPRFEITSPLANMQCDVIATSSYNFACIYSCKCAAHASKCVACSLACFTKHLTSLLNRVMTLGWSSDSQNHGQDSDFRRRDMPLIAMPSTITSPTSSKRSTWHNSGFFIPEISMLLVVQQSGRPAKIAMYPRVPHTHHVTRHRPYPSGTHGRRRASRHQAEEPWGEDHDWASFWGCDLLGRHRHRDLKWSAGRDRWSCVVVFPIWK